MPFDVFTVGRARTHTFHTLLNPLALLCVHDVHELGTHGTAVGFFESFVNFAEGRLILADIQTAGLKNGIAVGIAELMVVQIQVSNRGTLPELQRIEIGFLVATLTIGADELDDTNLLALVVRYRAGGRRRRGPHPNFGEIGEMLANRRMRNIADCVIRGARELFKVTSPRFRHGVWICQEGLIQFFNVRRIPTRNM